MFPEFQERSYETKPVRYWNDGYVYSSDGRRTKSLYGNIIDELVGSSTIFFVESITSSNIFPHIIAAAVRDDCSVLCDGNGKPFAVRSETKNKSSWLVQFDSWFEGKDYKGPIESLDLVRRIYEHLGVGSAPTPSSLGRKTMRYVWREEKIMRHTCVPLACESFVRDYGYGGISIVKQGAIGRTYSKMSEIDASQNYVGEVQFYKRPAGTPTNFSYLDQDYKTWFAEAKITIRQELPLGIFPVRKDDHRVYYPTERGVYTTHIWRETYDMAIQNDCDIQISEGWGWHSMTEDVQPWALWIFNKRISAPTKDVEKGVKKAAVSAIGSLGRGRDVWHLGEPGEDELQGGVPLIMDGIPIDIWAIQSYDINTAAMPHWQRHVVSCANNRVRNFALQYAEKGTLILIDTDGIFVRGEEAGRKYIEKHSLQSVGVPAGTWLSRLHHNFQILHNRMWISDEEPDRHGVLLERLRSQCMTGKNTKEKGRKNSQEY